MTTEPMEFVVLTGFLGSGKTTLLSEFLKGPDAHHTAVIVNEVGEIDLDGAILREGADDLPVAMLANGCICCQMGSSLAMTIEALLSAERPNKSAPLRRIVLETSGLSKPGPILRQISELARYRMRVAVVSTFDAARDRNSCEPDEALAQWAAANRLVATKLDVVADNLIPHVVEEMRSLNPLAEIVALNDRADAVRAAFAPLEARAGIVEPLQFVERDRRRIAVRTVRPTSRPAYGELANWLDNLAGALGDRLLRLKGLVEVAEHENPLLVQSVGTLFAAPRPFGTPGADNSKRFLVIIARDLGPSDLDAIEPIGLFRAG